MWEKLHLVFLCLENGKFPKTRSYKRSIEWEMELPDDKVKTARMRTRTPERQDHGETRAKRQRQQAKDECSTSTQGTRQSTNDNTVKTPKKSQGKKYTPRKGYFPGPSASNRKHVMTSKPLELSLFLTLGNFKKVNHQTLNDQLKLSPKSLVNSLKKSECESAKTIDKLHRWVTGHFLSMDHPCIKRFGENFEKLFLEFF